MDETVSALQDQLVKSFFRIKHLLLNRRVSAEDPEHAKCDMSLAEIELMKCIRYNALDSDCNAHVSDIQHRLSISKAGVSKMLSVLEKKACISRNVDRNNRRTLIITLTPEGREALHNLEECTDAWLTKIIHQLGEEQTKQFITLVNQFVDVTNEVIEQ